MWMQTPEGQKLIREIARNIVVDAAPEELDLFDELAADYLHNPTPPNLSARSKEEALAFGLGDVLVAVTPAAMAMVDAVLSHLITESISAAREESAEAIKEKVRNLFGSEKKEDKKEKNEKPAKQSDKRARPLNKEQLEQVKKLARKQAVQFGIRPEKAEKMANALIGSLALTK